MGKAGIQGMICGRLLITLRTPSDIVIVIVVVVVDHNLWNVAGPHHSAVAWVVIVRVVRIIDVVIRTCMQRSDPNCKGPDAQPVPTSPGKALCLQLQVPSCTSLLLHFDIVSFLADMRDTSAFFCERNLSP